MHILIADDHTIIRRGVRNVIAERYPETRISDCASLGEVDRMLTTSSPCLVILDLLFGDGNAIDHLSEWRDQHPKTKILVYSMVPEQLYAERIIALGGAGFLSKNGPESELLEAIDLVRNGGIYLSKTFQRTRGIKGKQGVRGPLEGLSDREIAVMHDLLAERGIKEIALRMEISPSTVATYKARLLDKLGLTTVSELRRWAEIHGITS